MIVQREFVDGEYKFIFKLYKQENNPHYLQIVTLYFMNDQNEIGHFKVEGFSNGNGSPYKSGRTMDMTIYLDSIHNGKGLARLMMKYLFESSENYFGEIPGDHNIYIDADGSNGFWDAIGMKLNIRTYETQRNHLEGAGFEKVIQYSDLRRWMNKTKGGKKSRKKRKQKKRKTRKQK